MSVDERRELIWKLRQDGMTLAAIGGKIGRSKEEVRRNVFLYERSKRERLKRQAMMNGLTRDQILKISVLNLELNERARNHFSWLQKYKSLTLSDIMAMTDEELHAPNFGKVTIALVRAAINTALANAEKADQ
jgi:hypothetical protein